MWSFLIFLFLVSTTQSAKILGIFPMTARSHYILGTSLMRALAEKGHDVTVISSFGEKTPPKGGSYRDIVLTGFVEEHDKKIKELNVFEKKKINPLIMAPIMAKMFVDMTEKTLNHTNVQELIHSDEKFDVVIIEEFLNQALKGFASHFGAHLVLLSTMGANSWVNPLVGNPTPLSYVPDPLLGYSSEMTFWQRLDNTFTYIFRETINYVYVLPKQDQLIKKYFNKDFALEDVMYNASLLLVNSHQSVNQPVPYVPRMVDIGGYHVNPPKQLPKDLQNYLDNAKHGVIYFSLGSNMKSSLVPLEKRQAFLDAFSKLKENVLWKWEEDELPGKPSNVRVAKWLPQQDILAHPNVKLFITHAGLLSTIETTYHGMPVLAIPIGGDQNLNALQIANQGFGLALRFHDVTAEALGENIKELLNNPSYRQNAKKKSELFHDRLVKPMDTAIYWIEYVIRHGGTSHLKVAALDLPWYKYLLLDVIAVVATTTIILLHVSFKIIKKLCCKKRRNQKIKKQ